MIYEVCPACDTNVVEGIASWPRTEEEKKFVRKYGLCTVTPDGKACCSFLEGYFETREEAETVALYIKFEEIEQLQNVRA